MKKLIKINALTLSLLFAVLMPLSAISADGPADSRRLTPEQRQARIAECKADPEKCRAEMQARRAQWCKDNAERCKEMQARMEKRMAECKASPEKCQAERQARFEQRFKRADADGNGMISRDEAQKALPRLAHHFDRIDTNKDGQISREEITAVRKARFERRRHDNPARTERPSI